jgi:hypothetical protein
LRPLQQQRWLLLCSLGWQHKIISTDDPQIIAAGLPALLYGVGAPIVHPSFGDAVSTPAPPKRQPQVFLFFLQYFETAYQSHFIHRNTQIELNYSYNQLNK